MLSSVSFCFMGCAVPYETKNSALDGKISKKLLIF